MESIDTELAARIRNDIVLGNYGEEERISEVQLCNTHKVSRTPVRLALRMLEHEGLIRRSEGRGYFVNAAKVNDVLQAVQVRGHLESLAARLGNLRSPIHMLRNTGELRNGLKAIKQRQGRLSAIWMSRSRRPIKILTREKLNYISKISSPSMKPRWQPMPKRERTLKIAWPNSRNLSRSS